MDDEVAMVLRAPLGFAAVVMAHDAAPPFDVHGLPIARTFVGDDERRRCNRHANDERRLAAWCTRVEAGTVVTFFGHYSAPCGSSGVAGNINHAVVSLAFEAAPVEEQPQ
jgi:hypothetical protein